MSDFKNKPGRKLIVPERRLNNKNNPFEVSVIPTLDALVNDAMSIIGSELSYYRVKTARGARLDAKEAKVVRDYVESLVKLNREAREAAKDQDLSNMGSEDLLKLAVKLLADENDRKQNQLLIKEALNDSTMENQVLKDDYLKADDTNNQILADDVDVETQDIE